MLEVSELLAIVQYVVEKGLQRGADEVEAYASVSTLTEAVAENNALHTASKVVEGGVGIRVIRGGRVGFSYTNSLKEEDILRALESALSIAEHVPKDPWWPGLPGRYVKYPRVGKLYSEKLANVGIEEVIEYVREMLGAAASRRELTVVYAGADVSFGAEALANSSGIEVWGKGTSASLSIEVVASDGSSVTPSVHCFEGSRVEIPDPEPLTRECVDKALKSLKPVRISSGRYEVLLSPYALDSLIGYTLAPALLGDNVVRGKSPIADKVGEVIASSEITIIDDGTLEGGLGSSNFDGEGVPTRKNELVVKGVLKGFVYDNYWGRRAGKGSTGNALRATYSSLPKVGFNNLMISRGSESVESYLGSAKKVLLIDNLQGAHTSVPETGEFSVVAAPAWIVSKGEFVAVKDVMIAGNIWDLIKSVSFISREVKSVGSFVAPWISFKEVPVVSKS